MQDYYPFNLGQYTKRITTSKKETQIWFDRALLQMYSFNHEETLNCCEKALEYDQNCAMIYFLKSIAQGINYNNCPEYLNPIQAHNQHESWKKANENKEKCSEQEKDLIQALQYKVGNGKSLLHKQNDINFANKMRKIYKKYPQDDFIAEIFAESLMNLRPWNLWVQKQENGLKYGDPYQDTLEIKEVLEKGLEYNQDHLGLRHLWIHLMEQSPYPEKALEQNFNKSLIQLSPDSGHLNHMPSHIYILCGKYEESIKVNELAIKNDEKYFQYRNQQKYPSFCSYIGFICHNITLLIYSAMFAGQYEKSYKGGEYLLQILNINCLKDNSSIFFPSTAFRLESFVPIILHVYIRFGKWEEIIKDEPFGQFLSLNQVFSNPDLYQSTIATLYYSKGIAYSVLAGKNLNEKNNLLNKAQKQIDLFNQAFNQIGNNRFLHNCNMKDVLAVAHDMIIGEYEYRCQNYQKAFQYLRNAVQKDDNLPYDEPWGWMIPTRHALGALLLECGIDNKNKSYIQEAELVYRQDLGEGVIRSVAHPNNIWSLVGLYKCLIQQGKKEQASKFKNILDEKILNTDISIISSCMCSFKKN
ncbi:hypothetical protein IMG5_091020 [Ichthyophthirius multifiliis]|uniref:Tetratricopeptide repeat protein n=1 Tax=Ichthyophthirius multifiliis TaxID=5932 RepID=G0QRA1_ICHMU|nr:hypothetical protein IMG5_091020 [Ichthyophthirius multifiliis]EGR32253.1 hypothetical protein IMG5_091020 [Ichthyophthirius multifiliis]|eukprot:XP_004035739.1 hypothetical protein IMG5_091020 [Ichthyophthirius multifiliis]